MPPAPRSPRSVRAAALVLGLTVAACAARSSAPVVLAPVASASASATASTSTMAAASASASASGPPADWVTMRGWQDAAEMGYCTAAQLADAHREFDALHGAVDALPADLSPSGATGARVARLFESPCFAGGSLMSGTGLGDLKEARSWALKEWWFNGGGTLAWNALDHANAIHFVPTLPVVLGAETVPVNDPRRAVLCPISGVECDPLAAGAALDLRREITRFSRPRLSHELVSTDDIQRCGREKPPGDESGWSSYLGCVSQLTPRYTTLPRARYRSPRGWLVLRGRRGHHTFCDESRAYDLATGAAYIASRCSGLVLGARGKVDQGATAQRSAVTTQTGVVSVDGLRRLALMLHLGGSLQENIQPYEEFPVPEHVPLPEPYTGSGSGSGSGSGGGWGHSGQTRISFEIVDAGAVTLQGTFVWPDSDKIGDQIVDDLLVSTEATLRPGCPPAALPAALAHVPSLGGVSKHDATASSLQSSADELSRALTSLRPGPGCPRR